MSAAVLARIDRWLVAIEERPQMFGMHAYVIEGEMRQLVAVRQMLRGYEEFDASAAMQHFLYTMVRQNHPCGLVGLLRDHGMLGRGYRDAFGDLPRLLGDFARWVDHRWPVGGVPRVEPAALWVWLRRRGWGRLRSTSGWRRYSAPIRDDHGKAILIALPEDGDRLLPCLGRILPTFGAVHQMDRASILDELVG